MSRPVRVALIAGNLETGGMQVLVMELMRHLDRARFDPILIYFKSPNGFEDEIQARKWRCRKVPMSREYRGGEIRRLARVLHEEGVEIVHTHSDFANFAGRAAALLTGPNRILAHYHNCYFHRLDERFRALETLLRPYTDMMVACSEGVETFLKETLGVPGECIRVVLNGRSLEAFLAAGKRRKEIREQRGIAPETFHIVHTARLEPHKAPERLLRALCLLGETDGPWRATFVGGGSLFEDLQKQASQMRTAGGTGAPLSERVEFVGWSDGIPEHLAASDVFVLCSKNEGLGLSVIEALAAGTPVISSDIPGPREVTQNGRAGLLIDTENPEALAAALRRVRTDEPLRERLRVAARERIGIYDVDRFVRETEESYDEVRVRSRATRERPRGLIQTWRFLHAMRHAGR